MNWGPIIGVIIGFLLSQVATVVSWAVSSRRDKQLIRLLVSLEIDQNLALLNDYWHNVSLPPDEDKEGEKEVEADRLARRATEIPLPLLSERAFNSQLGVLPKALRGHEIRLIWCFYEELAQVPVLHAWLVDVSNGSSVDTFGFPSASRAIRSEEILSATFKTRKAGAIFDLRKTIQKLISEGNPLNHSNSQLNRTRADLARAG